MKIRGYIPDFKLAFEHFCIHTGGRGVIEEIEKQLQLAPDSVQPSKDTLFRYGNTSSSSIWLVLFCPCGCCIFYSAYRLSLACLVQQLTELCPVMPVFISTKCHAQVSCWISNLGWTRKGLSGLLSLRVSYPASYFVVPLQCMSHLLIRQYILWINCHH